MSRTRPRPWRRRASRYSRRGRGPAGVSAAIVVGTRPDLDLEAVRLDRQRLLQMHLIAMMIDQFEALQDHADRERRLMHRKAAADAGALAVAERLPGVDRTRRLGFAAEILRVEGVGIGPPDAWVAMQCQRKDQNKCVLLE